ncbi:MAG: response regulator, partial [Lachnospiraceae bacterium]|nr:response regulator [Lachnospiraceae bacterium]
MEKILIVEDDEMVRCGIEDVLKMRDWNTETASTFAEGMKKIKANKYMLYILDMKLPDGNGITLCREIRKKTC